MVERQLPKLHTRVRFPSPAPKERCCKAAVFVWRVKGMGRVAEAMRNGHIPFTRPIQFARVTYQEGSCAMNKIVKFVVLPLAALIVVVVAIGAYVAATFDPNNYKGQIVQAVKDKTKRTLKLDG